MGLSVVVQAQAKPSKADDWLILVSPFVWASSLDGELGLGGQQATVNESFTDLVKNVHGAFMGNIELSNRQYGLYLDMVDVHAGLQDQVLGQALQVSIHQRLVTLSGFYRLYRQPLAGDTVFGEPRHFTLEPSLGLRWSRVQAGLTAPTLGLDVDKAAHWSDPFIGTRFSVDLDKRWNISGLVDVGGWDTGSKKSHNAELYLGYRTFLGEYPLIVRAGYRSLTLRYQTQDFTGESFTYHLRQAGPVLGASFRF